MAQRETPPIVGIGASAGGVKALQAFFKALPGDSGAAYVVVLHLAPDMRSELAGILASCTDMPVAQIEGEMPLRANNVYVIAPDRRLHISDHSVASEPFEEPRGKRAPIDLFFRSLAEQHPQPEAPLSLIGCAEADAPRHLAAIDPVASMQAIDNPALKQAAEQVRAQLQKAVNAL